ncbi:hypothetical protein [Actinomadura sp. DC4]|nr:hypothetical protein [Actinomadura sp. DC4]MDN3357775.1 hypothetical protein [Actinomadura sp. DC4]
MRQSHHRPRLSLEVRGASEASTAVAVNGRRPATRTTAKKEYVVDLRKA